MGGNKACCISRGPPSPDGSPPRPVVIAADSEDPEPQRQADNPPVFSWPSRSTTTVDQAEVSAIFDEAADASDAEGKSSIISSKISRVRVKLRKHLSRESDFSNKRASRSSQGNSDESIARREELKRIQKKRIEEELRHSEDYDEDARSVGVSAFDISSRRVTGNSVISKNGVDVGISPVSSLSRRCSFSATERMSASRDHGSGSGRRRRSSVPEMPPEPVLRAQKLPSIDDTLQRRSSWRLSFSSSRRASRLRALSQDHTASQVIELEKAVTVEVKPVEASETTLETTTSKTPSTAANYLKWLRGQGLRLPSPTVEANHSFAHLHVPGAHPDHSKTPEPPSFGGVDGQQEQPVSFATRLQHLHISQRLASSTKGPLSQASSSRQPSSTSNLASEENSQPVTTHATRTGRTSSSGLTEAKIPQSWGRVLQDQQDEERRDRASAYHASGARNRTGVPGRQTRHSMSTSSAIHTSADTTTEPLVPVPAVVLEQHDQSRPIGVKKQRSTTVRTSSKSTSKRSLRKSESDLPKSSGLLGGSRNFLSCVWKKETSAPAPVELEPDLQGPLGRRKTSSVVKSVFVEEFDEIDRPVRKSSSRSSFLSSIGLPRLGKLTSRSYDGSLDHSNTVPKRKPVGFKIDLPNPGAIPRRSVSQKVPESPSLWKTTQLESTEIMWHKAIRASIDARAMGIRKEFEMVQPSPMTRPSMAFPKMPRKSGDRGLADIADDSDDDADETTHLSRKQSTHEPGNHVHTLQVPKITYDRVGSTTIEFAQNALTEQLAIQGALGPQRLGTHGSKSPISQISPGPGSPSNALAQSADATRRNSRISFTRRVTPPEAWSRFPSHDREQRCASAGAADKVAPSDFATIKLDDGTEVFVTGERKHLHHHHNKESGHKHHASASLPEKFKVKLRTSLDRLRTKQSTALNDAVLGRRSSTSAGGHLREPDLELLPSMDIRVMTETKLVEIEADEANRRKERESRMVGRLPSPHGSDGMEDSATTALLSHDQHVHYAEPSISIAEPQFYNDLVEDSKKTAFSIRSVRTFEELGNAGDMMSDEERTMSKKSKFGTWSHKNKGKMGLGELRKSTVDFELQARLMEETERENLLNAVEGVLASRSGEDAWKEV